MNDWNAIALGGTLLLASTLHAQDIVIDGLADVAYGDAIMLQQVQTGFGDADLGTEDFCNGSEIDALFARVSGDTLHLMIAGNLESNFNKIDLFIDAVPGVGQNPLRGDNVDVDFDALNRMGRFEDPATGEIQPGLTFDAGFVPDFWITFTGGSGTPDKKGVAPYDTYLSYAQLPTLGGDAGDSGFAGPGSSGSAGVLAADNLIRIAIDNSNVAGVSAGEQAELDGGAGVFTGVEMSIPLSVLGHSPTDPILVTAFVNGNGHDFISNQVLGPIPAGGNLGEPRFVNFADIAGDQYAVAIGGADGNGPECIGDFNTDDSVNGADFGIMLAAWGEGWQGDEDLNGDGAVNGADVGLLLAQWGDCPGENANCGTCEFPGKIPGCSDDECEVIVCAIDPICCTTVWDSFCASLAQTNCDCGL